MAPNVTGAEDRAYPLYLQPGIEPKYVTQLEGLYARSLPVALLAGKARKAVVDHEAYLVRKDGVLPPFVVLDLPCTFFMLRTNRSCARGTGNLLKTKVLFVSHYLLIYLLVQLPAAGARGVPQSAVLNLRTPAGSQGCAWCGRRWQEHPL